MDLQHVHDVAVGTARAAGELLRRGLREQKRISHKSSAVDLLTDYDEAAQALITERLLAAFPDHGLIAEESTTDDSSLPETATSTHVWHIDPLDGTNNFTHGFPVFAVSLALYEGDQPLVGVIYDPTRDECFSAIAGRGAYLTKAGNRSRLQVSMAGDLLESLLATGFPYDRHHSQDDNLAEMGAFLKRARGVRRAGAAALDLAYVAAGRLDGYWEFKLNSWDVAAGALLVQEAGGTVTDTNGQRWRLTPKISLIASNGRIHQAMLSVLRTVGRSSAGDRV